MNRLNLIPMINFLGFYLATSFICKGINVLNWSFEHKILTIFMIILYLMIGVYSYFKLKKL